MRAARRHPAEAAAADLTNAYYRWATLADPEIAAHVEAVNEWLRGISAGEQVAARAAAKAASTPTPKPAKVSIRQRVTSQPMAAFPATAPDDAPVQQEDMDLLPPAAHGHAEVATRRTTTRKATSRPTARQGLTGPAAGRQGDAG